MATIGAIAGVVAGYSIHNRGLAPLVRASDALPHRSTEARVSGGFAYRPVATARRRADPAAPPEKLGVMVAVSRLIAAASESASSTTLREAGIASFVAGDAERAVDIFEDSLGRSTGARDLARAIDESRDGAALSDLAAAYLTRSDGEESVDLLAAINAAERAWMLTKTPELAWNRALAFSAANAHDAAIEAWRDYLAIDPGSAWSAEAHQRMEAVAASRPQPRDSAKRSLLAAIADSGKDGLLRAVSADAGIARVVVEEELLPAWGEGDPDAFSKAQRVARAVALVSGDFIAADSVARIGALDAARAERARAALVTFAAGRKAQAAYRYDEALPLLREAATELDALGIPLAARAKLFVATLHFYAKDAERSLAMCSEIAGSVDAKRFPSVIAQCAWNEGTIETGRRRFDRAKSAFESARLLFARMNDIRSVAALEVRLEENDRWTGDVASAWSHMLRAFRQGAAERGYIPLSEAAKLADGAGMPFAALAFYRSAIDAARAEAERADGHLSLAQLLWRLGRTDDARTELNAATRSMKAIASRMAAARLESDLVLARSMILLTTRPEEVARDLDVAIAKLEADGNRRRIARARVLQAKARLAHGDRAGAEQSLHAGLAEIESQRREISTDEERLSLVDTAREATELLVALLFDDGRSDAALAAVERSKARLLLDAIGDDDDFVQATEIAHPDRDEAFVEYFVLPDRVLIWTITADRTRAQAIAADRAALVKLVDRFQTALIKADESAVRREGTSLFDLLLQPVWREIAASRRFVISADGVLHRVPFAALSPEHRMYVVDSHDVANVPSFTWLAARPSAPPPAAPERVVAVVPRTDDAGFERLAAAENDAREIASRFPGASVLTGEVSAARGATATNAASLFHFAGHATVDDRRPGRSALVMSGGELLRASEIARWPLQRMRLAMLAACSTGAGRVTSDGTASVARAFLLAGSRSVVATLWPVDDAASSELTTHFYATLAAGGSARDALSAAQRSVVRHGATKRQFDWAAFQFIGSR